MSMTLISRLASLNEIPLFTSSFVKIYVYLLGVGGSYETICGNYRMVD